MSTPAYTRDFAKRANLQRISRKYQRDLAALKKQSDAALRAEIRKDREKLVFDPKKHHQTDMIDGEMRVDITLRMCELILTRSRSMRSTSVWVLRKHFTEDQINQCSAKAVEAALFNRWKSKL